MRVVGDANAVLLDLTVIAEQELQVPIVEVHREVCSMPPSPDDAYIKLTFQTHAPFPTLFTGEVDVQSTEVNVVATYNKGTYILGVQYDRDLMNESKAYTFAEKTQEVMISAKTYPSYYFTNSIIVPNLNAYDGVPFYVTSSAGTKHSWAGAGRYPFYNSIGGTGNSIDALWNDLSAAMALMRTFQDDKGRVLNPNLQWGEKQFVIRCSASYEQYFVQLLHNGINPVRGSQSLGSNSGNMPVGASGVQTIWGTIAKLIVDPYLDVAGTVGGVNYAHTWFLDYVGMPQRPFVFSESRPLESYALGIGSPLDVMENLLGIYTKHRWLMGTYRTDRSIRVTNA